MTDSTRAQLVTNDEALSPSREFAIETWRTEDGLPQNSVTAVLQTRRGYIWCSTYNGIVQFDGVHFRVFDSSNTRGLANSRVTSMFEDSRGTVWIGHDTGEVSRFTEGDFTTLKLPTEWRRNPVKAFVPDEAGDVWAVNQVGEAVRLKDGRIVHPPYPMGQNPFVNPQVVVDKSGRAFVARNGVAAQFTSSGYQVLDFRDPAASPYYAGLAAARNGNLWVAGEGRVRQWDGRNWATDAGPFPWPDASVTTMLETSSGRLLVGTLQHGLLVLDPETGWSFLTHTNGLPQDWICTLTEDSENNLWVGTGGGLALLRERKVTMLSPPDEWQGRPVLSITRAQAGAVWAATEGAGVYRLQDGQWSKFSLANPFVWSVMEDSQQRVWAGTWGGGLYRFNNGQFVELTNDLQFTEPVAALEEFPAGTLWIGTGSGLARMRDNAVVRFANLGGAAAGDVRAIEIGPDGELWFGTQGSGLGCISNGVLRSYSVADGLPGQFILSLHAEPGGTLWIGTLDQGLCRFKDGAFRALTTEHGLPANIIYHIEDDKLGYLWFNSPLGIFRISKGELNACADGELKTLEVLSYGKAEGLSTLAGTGGFTPSGFRTPDGRLWFSTARGIAVVSPRAARRNPVDASVWIEEVLVDGLSVVPEVRPARAAKRGHSATTPVRAVTLPPGRRQLEVLFTGLSFSAPDRVRFKYRLEGLDPDWMPAGSRRRVTYSFLPPGEYRFQVTACNSDGVWSPHSDLLAIVVEPHIWQTWWFKTLLLAAGATVLGLVILFESRQRMQRKLERIARERELERERARIAQDIHDDLGASLTRIGMLSQSAAGDLDDPPRVASGLNQIYDTARNLTRAMDEIVWAVNPRHDTLESLTNYLARFAHDFLSAAQIRCRFDAPTTVPETTVRSEIRHNLFLAFKETLNNAVKHSGATEVRVSFEFTPGRFTALVSDNGKGFDPEKPSSSAADDRVVTGYGLAGIRQRLEQICGRLEIQSRPGQGTRVALIVPLA